MGVMVISMFGEFQCFVCVYVWVNCTIKSLNLFFFLMALDGYPFGLVFRTMGCWMSIKSIGHGDQSKWGGHFLNCSC